MNGAINIKVIKLLSSICHRFALVLIILIFSSFISTLKAKNNRYEKLTESQLLEIGQNLSDQGDTEEAMIAMTVLLNKYRDYITIKDKSYIWKAHYILWEIYFFTYFDYVNSAYHLKKALELCDDNNNAKSWIYLSMGIMNHSMASGCASDELYKESKRLYELAFDFSIKNREMSPGIIALINLIVISSELGDMNDIRVFFDEIDKLERNNLIQSKEVRANYSYAKQLYRALSFKKENRLKESIEALDPLIENEVGYVPKYDSSNRRALCNILSIRSGIYRQLGDYESCIRDLRHICDICNSVGLYDEKMSALLSLSECYNEVDSIDEMLDAKISYLELKDSVLNIKQISSVHELKIIDKLHHIDKEMESIKGRNFVYGVIIIIILLVALGIGVVLYVVRKKKKIIDEANEQLYLRNVELLDMMDSYQQQIESFKASANKVDQESGTEDLTPNAETEDIQKYQKSLLSEERKDFLKMRIEDIINKDEIICSQNFSAARLSELLEVPYKYLSQVINERYGGNFFSMVNDRRVKIACRLMQTVEGQSMSVEGIANSVGFKSRSAFGKVFKMITGLNPSDYMKLAINKTKKING